MLAIEPTPRTAELLRRTVALNGCEGIVTVETCALGAEAGIGELSIEPVLGHNSLLPLPKAKETVSVTVRTLDELLPADARPALVKLDVEGLEPAVWRGMARLRADSHCLAVIVEYGPSHLARSGISPVDWGRDVRGIRLYSLGD